VCLATARSEITSRWAMAALDRALRHEAKNLVFARAERADGVVVDIPGQQAGDHFWVHGSSTRGDPPYCLDELVAVEHRSVKR
jgi:hypothetical protein